VVTSALERAFPETPLVAEEDASALEGEDAHPLAQQTLGSCGGVRWPSKKQEAVTDLDRRPLDFHTGRRFERNRGIVAANRHLHPPILDVLRACEH